MLEHRFFNKLLDGYLVEAAALALPTIDGRLLNCESQNSNFRAMLLVEQRHHRRCVRIIHQALRRWRAL
jgi:hypothetical protein